ncbi:hypothetical protein FSOLCH5_006732 [Fusarium solani]|uniref:Pyruvate/Phosphoenolpyruvate kinase-like domain-containing protein n=1 Tax=Fusarium solani TaxID=169388 RepID=A0A9P9K000_FUSSL|nr:Pyruvate/Phosphoenolpyruvate kinase-like domain-containing protein [Fusarium solani]KAH7243118.1 Pyruvate/Phosphoenolpyruvate kinase-like domain-containing protein [Fusarium solani]KAJ3468263.1 hypothetical protein MRS44_002328 [Fusarium solani]KAJ4218472.1 hypothetical protein NW759_008366 [Fusarium solani]
MSNQGYLDQPDLHVRAPWRSALLTFPGNLKGALKAAHEDPSKTLFGVGQGIPSPFVTKVIASTRPDFIWLDVEHGMYDRLALHDCIHAVQHHSEGKTMAIVRVPKHDEVSLTTALDAGASGIVIPCCESAEEVEKIIKTIYYPPVGRRSFSPWVFTPGISDTSLYEEDSFNMKTANRHIAVIAQIESVKGVKNAREIAAVEGVSAMLFGPGDFSADAGIPLKVGGEPHPTLAAAMGEWAAAGRENGIPLVGAAMGPGMVPSLIEQGFRAIVVSMDVWGLANMIHGQVEQGRKDAQELGKPSEKEQSNGVDGESK